MEGREAEDSEAINELSRSPSSHRAVRKGRTKGATSDESEEPEKYEECSGPKSSEHERCVDEESADYDGARTSGRLARSVAICFVQWAEWNRVARVGVIVDSGASDPQVASRLLLDIPIIGPPKHFKDSVCNGRRTYRSQFG